MNYEKLKTNNLFPLLTFNEGEEEEFKENFYSRGFYLYKQVYEVLKNWEPDTMEIPYEIFKNVIKYDKSIRDKLYIYLAAAEENLRNIIYDELEIDAKLNSEEKACIEINKVKLRTSEDIETESKLYYYGYAKNFDFGLIVKLINKFELGEKYKMTQSDLNSVRILRNKVMHHNMLLLSRFTARKSIEEEISEIELEIEALYRLLPTEKLREGKTKTGGFTMAINRSNYPNGDISKEAYNNVICLHPFKDGRFIK